jgi:hypothetical protein
MLAAAIAATLSAPMLASADSDLGVGGTGTNAQVNLDFQITIGDFVYFQVGSLAAGTVDRVDFDLTAGAGTVSGSGGPFAANGGVGDGADGMLSIELRTNVANVSIAATGGDLTGPGGATIPFTEITATDGGVVDVPDFGATITPFAAAPGALTDTWTYTYDNSSVYAPGTYSGTVTYTVTTL